MCLYILMFKKVLSFNFYYSSMDNPHKLKLFWVKDIKVSWYQKVSEPLIYNYNHFVALLFPTHLPRKKPQSNSLPICHLSLSNWTRQLFKLITINPKTAPYVSSNKRGVWTEQGGKNFTLEFLPSHGKVLGS